MADSTIPSTVTVQTELIPDCVRESIGNILFRRFMENIRDPDKLQRYNELGQAFLERYEREHAT